MKKILLVHGPNLNLLGQRDARHYGMLTLADIETIVKQKAFQNGYDTAAIQSNHEGVLIDWIQKNAKNANGIIINPGALAHYSYALHDALIDTDLPCVEVHLSNIKTREKWRQYSVVAPACIAHVSGKKEKGYEEAVKILIRFFRHPKKR